MLTYPLSNIIAINSSLAIIHNWVYLPIDNYYHCPDKPIPKNIVVNKNIIFKIQKYINTKYRLVVSRSVQNLK